MVKLQEEKELEGTATLTVMTKTDLGNNQSFKDNFRSLPVRNLERINIR